LNEQETGLLNKPRKKLLIVDDIEINRIILNDLFCDVYDVLEAENGRIALNYIEKLKDELIVILLDLVMPVMDGFEVLREMNASGLISRVPVILITGENDDEKALLGYGLGVSDLVHKPFNPEIVRKRVDNVVDLYAYKNYLEQKLEDQKKALEQQEGRIKQFNLFLIDALSATVEFRNFESGEHVKRMRNITQLLCEKAVKYYPLAKEEIESISSAAALHDIGKIAIPDSVLLKPGPLTKEEFEIMKTHPVKGSEILEGLNYIHDEQYYKYCYDICRHHHERWDGRGYPDGLKGNDIPIWAQAASVADVYDALTSNRVYKPAYTHDQAVAMIINGECGAFNPVLMECFIAAREDLRALTARRGDLKAVAEKQNKEEVSAADGKPL
jgi:putative two-component system response regulator